MPPLLHIKLAGHQLLFLIKESARLPGSKKSEPNKLLAQ